MASLSVDARWISKAMILLVKPGGAIDMAVAVGYERRWQPHCHRPSFPVLDGMNPPQPFFMDSSYCLQFFH